MDASIIPEPRKSNTGNNRVFFCEIDFSSLKEVKYTAINTMKIPVIFKNEKDSLYKNIPKKTGIN